MQEEEETNSQRAKTHKKSKYAAYESAPVDAVYFLFDVETTGSKRNFDKIISISLLAYDSRGNKLDSFARLINPGGVPMVSYLTKHVHSKQVCA